MQTRAFSDYCFHSRGKLTDTNVERPVAQDVRLGLNYRYERRDSNDPEKRFDGQLVGISFGFDWWRR